MFNRIREFFARRRRMREFVAAGREHHSIHAYQPAWVDTMPVPPPRSVAKPKEWPPAPRNFTPPRPLPASKRAVIDGDDLPDSDPFMALGFFRQAPASSVESPRDGVAELDSGRGGEFGGAGASGSWEPQECRREADMPTISDINDSSGCSVDSTPTSSND